MLNSTAPPPPKTITKEWEEAANQRALEMKLNPITGMWFFLLFIRSLEVICV